MVGSDGKYQLVNARLAPQVSPMPTTTPQPTIVTAPAPRKAPWERAKDLAGAVTAIVAALGIALSVMWYAAKPVIDKQYCTVEHAKEVEARLDKHELKQLETETALAATISAVNVRLGKIELHLCIMAANGKEIALDRCVRDSK